MKKAILAIGIVILFICMSFNSISGIQIQNITIIKSGRGNTLYVGGNGTGNYSKIQDAIDNASDGDTVFVYDDSSPYYEWDILINKPINLIGENSNTTTIDSDFKGGVIDIASDNVKISGFSIIDGYKGISVYFNTGDNVIISDNHFINCSWGIEFHTKDNCYVLSNSFRGFEDTAIFADNCVDCTISDNIIIRTESGDPITVYADIHCEGFGENYVVTNNTLICDIMGYDTTGLLVGNADNNIIEGNKFSGYDLDAIRLYSVKNNIITHNNFNNSGGILIEDMSHSNKIINNNFIKNKYDAIERLLCFNNLWDGNYWDKWIGFKYKLPIFQRFPHIILFAIDKHPAKEPYDI